ncbi:MAG: V-type ATPase subunit [Cellulosilyticaceae bacterium]
MNAFASYYAVNTKLHTRKRALLDTQDWNKIMEYTAVSQLTDFLKSRYGYSDYLEKSRIEGIHRTELEIVLHRYLVAEIEKILHYFSGKYKEFFKLLLMKYEIYDLQLMLREIAREEDMLGIANRFVHSKTYSDLNYEKILGSRSVPQMIESLKGTIYYETLKTTTQEDACKREFHMEMKLYMLYYKLLMSKASGLEKQDAAIAQALIGKKIDLLNIQWIYRATKYYDISREEILVYSLPGGNISYNKLKKLIYTKSIEEFKTLANKALHYPLFKESKDDALLVRDIDEVMYKLIKSIHVPKSIAMPLQYIYGLEIEVDDLVAVTEGIRYEMSREEIQKYLVVTI